jgi:hypothetical protein
VFGGLNRLLASALVAGVVLVLPPAALADCGGGPSAEHVYTECLSSGGGGKHTTGGGGKHTTAPGNPTSGTHTSSGSTGSTSVPLSKQTTKKLQKAGTDGHTLKNLVSGYGGERFLQSSSSTAATEPTAVGSAFDLGSGPTALLIVLAGTAILLLGATGFRGVRQRRH